jgi:hypothetical protein
MKFRVFLEVLPCSQTDVDRQSPETGCPYAFSWFSLVVPDER